MSGKGPLLGFWDHDPTPEERAERWHAIGAEMAERQRASQRLGPPEPAYRYVIEFDCMPSEFDRIKLYLAERATANRSYRYYPTNREGR